jgi:hypothetical protein
MNKSFSKIRHIQETNLVLENRRLEEKSKHFLTEADSVALTTTYPDLLTFKPKIDAAIKNGEKSVGMYGTKAVYFQAIPDPAYTSGSWIVKVWNFAITRYGSGYQPDFCIAPGEFKYVPDPDNPKGGMKFILGSDNKMQGYNPATGVFAYSSGFESYTDDASIAEQISSHFTTSKLAAANLSTVLNSIPNVLNLVKTMRPTIKNALTGTAKAVFGGIQK